MMLMLILLMQVFLREVQKPMIAIVMAMMMTVGMMMMKHGYLMSWEDGTRRLRSQSLKICETLEKDS